MVWYWKSHSLAKRNASFQTDGKTWFLNWWFSINSSSSYSCWESCWWHRLWWAWFHLHRFEWSSRSQISRRRPLGIPKHSPVYSRKSHWPWHSWYWNKPIGPGVPNCDFQQMFASQSQTKLLRREDLETVFKYINGSKNTLNFTISFHVRFKQANSLPHDVWVRQGAPLPSRQNSDGIASSFSSQFTISLHLWLGIWPPYESRSKQSS